jgi:hypothetical protein
MWMSVFRLHATMAPPATSTSTRIRAHVLWVSQVSTVRPTMRIALRAAVWMEGSVSMASTTTHVSASQGKCDAVCIECVLLLLPQFYSFSMLCAAGTQVPIVSTASTNVTVTHAWMEPRAMTRSSTTHATAHMATQENDVTHTWTGATLNHAWIRQHASRQITHTHVCVGPVGQARCATWRWSHAVMQLYAKVGVLHVVMLVPVIGFQEQHWQFGLCRCDQGGPL